MSTSFYDNDMSFRSVCLYSNRVEREKKQAAKDAGLIRTNVLGSEVRRIRKMESIQNIGMIIP